MHDALGVGSLLADDILLIDESFLKAIPGSKGGMEYLPLEALENIVSEKEGSLQRAPGGSAANVMRGLAHLGRQCILATKVGADPLAKILTEDLKKNGIELFAVETKQSTGRSLSLITPDGERTMRTFLGACSAWRPQDLEALDFSKTRLVHIEGYTLLHPGLTRFVMKRAKEAGALVSFDLSSFEVVAQNKEEIVFLLDRYIDVLIANADETRQLTGYLPERGCGLLKDLCPTVAITMGEKGSFIGHKGVVYQCPSFPAIPLDTTGAGDLFAAGFLHGYLNNSPPKECARIGALCGGAVVKVLGTTLSEDTWKDIRRLAERS